MTPLNPQRLAQLLRAGAFNGVSLRLEGLYPQGASVIGPLGKKFFIPVVFLTLLMSHRGAR